MLRWLRANGCEWDAGNLSDGGARGVRNARVDPASRCSQPNEDWGGNLHGAAFCLATKSCVARNSNNYKWTEFRHPSRSRNRGGAKGSGGFLPFCPGRR
jgi:hypothetical protein